MTNLRAAREKKGLSVMDLARMSGIGYRSLYQYESGSTPVPYEKACRLAELLECPVCDILEIVCPARRRDADSDARIMHINQLFERMSPEDQRLAMALLEKMASCSTQ